jgi:hypothetical protein
VAWVNVSKRNGHGGGRSVRGAAGGDRQRACAKVRTGPARADVGGGVCSAKFSRACGARSKNASE